MCGFFPLHVNHTLGKRCLGLQKDSADARAFSFIKILELMKQMLEPPVMLFVENVVGFETSNTHAQLIQVLTNIGFTMQEYILSPLQFGVPYSRPRYFCLAKRKPFSFMNTSLDSLLVRTPFPFMPLAPAMSNCSNNVNGREDEVCISCEPISNFLEPQSLPKKQRELRRVELEDLVSTTEGSKYDGDHISVEIHKPPSVDVIADREIEEGDADKSPLDTYSVPLSLIERWGSAMDIVYPESKRCCCFTKSYYRYVKGTGSLLATSKNIDSNLCEGVHVPLKDLGLRFFTPREVANLHSFPEDFRFPSHVTLKQRYALLGNSLSVAVVAPLLGYLFSNHDDNGCASFKS